MTQTHVSASGCCSFSDSVGMCHIFSISYKSLWGVSLQRLFTSFLWRLSLCLHFVCHPEEMINLSVPMSLFQSVSLCFSLFLSLSLLYFSDFLVERDNDYCVCETPCNMTRYGKEMSFVKIPSKASAKYLAKKFNKTEQYIAWVTFWHLICPMMSVEFSALLHFVFSFTHYHLGAFQCNQLHLLHIKQLKMILLCKSISSIMIVKNRYVI